MPLSLPDGTQLPDPPPREVMKRTGPGRPLMDPADHFKRTYDAPIAKLRWTHDMIIDVILEHPEWDQRQLANHFGYSDTWVHMVIQSDAFQAKLAERRDEILNPEIRSNIEERFKALAQHSLAVLHKKLENPNVSDNLALRSVELAAKALGLGARQQAPTANVQVAIVVPPKAEREVPV